MIKTKVQNRYIRSMARTLGFRSALMIDSESFISRPNTMSFFGLRKSKTDKFMCIEIIVIGRNSAQYQIGVTMEKNFKVSGFLGYQKVCSVENVDATRRNIFDELKALKKKVKNESYRRI